MITLEVEQPASREAETATRVAREYEVAAAHVATARCKGFDTNVRRFTF